MKLKLRTQLLIPNIIALSLMFFIAVVVFFSINSLLKNSKLVEHTYRVIDNGNELLMYMIDQETGMRGFAVTGEDEFLEPYKNGSSNFTTLIGKMKIIVNDNSTQVVRLNEIEQQANLWKSKLANKYISLRKNIKAGEDYRVELFNLIASGNGKRNMDNIQNLVASSGLSQGAQNQIIIDMINMETGLRGFLLNNKEEYLEPYYSAKSQLNKHFDSYNIRQSVQNAANIWINSYAEKAITINKSAMKSSKMEDLYSEFAKKKGKQYMDKIRSLISVFINAEAELLKQRKIDAESTATLTKSILIVFTLLAIIISLLIIIIVTNRTMLQLGGEPDVVAKITKKISEGDLTGNYQIDNRSVGIYHSMLNMSVNLKNIVTKIRNASLQIASASEQLNNGSQDLSSATSEQASSVEEVSSTVEEMTSSFQQNSDSSLETEKISKLASKSIREVSNQSLEAVEMNKQISEKIQIVNDIAFQTNILALNAAVEAARAGKHGKGFAVVANEVQKLAERSRKAANEIVGFAKKSLIATEKTNQKLTEMLPQVQKTTQLVQEISASITEQTNGANQVNSSVQQLNNITQQNAASSEEMASNAEELSAQAEQLKEIISYFKFEKQEYSLNTSIKSNTPVSNLNKEANLVENDGIDLKMSQDVDDDYEKF